MTAPDAFVCRWCGVAHDGGPEYCHAAATAPTGTLDPQFCITCHQLLDHRSQDWFWNGDHHAPQHFACRQQERTTP